MVKQTDLLVIGGGMAGAIAAITAAQSGLSAILVRQGNGATAISSGAVDLNGSVEWLRRIQGAQNDYAPILRDSVAGFLDLMQEAGYPHTGNEQRNLLLINNLGTVKETQLCPASMEQGDLYRLEGANILFVGIQGFSDFDAAYISNSIRFFSESKLIETELRTGFVEIQFPRVKHTANLSPFDLARLLDDEQVAVEMAGSIREKTDLTIYTHIAFPPILGLRNPNTTIEILRGQLGLPCFEILTAPPSVPGYRLQKALDKLLGRYGVEIIHARVTGFTAEANNIKSVVAVDKSVQYDFYPHLVVLSSGKFISGGIQWNGALDEPAFHLPVCVDGCFDLASGMSTLLSDQFVSDQRMFSAGIKVDGQMHPLAPDGKVIYSNLMAAGSVISGYNYSQGQGGLGIPLISGMICGRYAAEQIVGEGALL